MPRELTSTRPFVPFLVLRLVSDERRPDGDVMAKLSKPYRSSPGPDLCPQLLVTLSGPTGRREGGNGRSALGHLLNDRQGGDHRVGHAGAVSRDRVDHRPVQAFATVGHGEERDYLGSVALRVGHETDQLVEGAHGK